MHMFEPNPYVDSPLERRNGLALGGVERLGNDVSVLQLDLWRVWVVLERQSMLHPFITVTY